MKGMLEKIFESLKTNFKGDLDAAPATLLTYSRDASLFEIKPRLVVFPKDGADVMELVNWVNDHRAEDPSLSLTARSAGTDMSGGAIGASIIIDFTRYMNQVKEVQGERATVQPGCFYRDFDKVTRAAGYIMPAYTASREICAVGGMVGNNAGGEKSIKYGKTENYVEELKVVWSDGKEYTIRSLSLAELQQKMIGDSFEVSLYRRLYDLITTHYEEIMAAKPQVSKNSSGYYLWNVYNREQQTFDLCQLIVGSQGTLGLVTEITFRLVPIPLHSNLLVVFLPSLKEVSALVGEIIPFGPESLETYDDYSLKLAVKFFFDFFKQLGWWKTFRLGWQFLPEVWMMLWGGVPKMILMVEFTGATIQEVSTQLKAVRTKLAHFGFHTHITASADEADKYWRIRHESFNLLRKHVRGKRTAPFIDDIIVKPEYLPEFLPQIQTLLNAYHLDYTVQGHLGNGNFHIIPLMDLTSPLSAHTILELSGKVFDLVTKYHGSNSAEHNDGIIRTPYLRDQFGEKIVKLFEQTKKIFDPAGIFNPGKKVGGTFDDIRRYLIKNN